MQEEKNGILKLINLTAEKYPGFLRMTSLLIGLVHVALFAMFFLAGHPYVACINIISITVYVICFRKPVANESILSIYRLFMVEITAFSFVISIVFDDNLMFALYCIALIPFSVMTYYMLRAVDRENERPFNLTFSVVLLIVAFVAEMVIGSLLPGFVTMRNQVISHIITDMNLTTVVICTVIACVGFLNITFEKDEAIQRNLREAIYFREKAEAATETKSAFLASMSHEIRTPINAVLGMDEMILMESTDEKITDYARDIKSAGNTLLSLINDILDSSKIEAGGMTIDPIEYSLTSLMSDCYNVARISAQDKGLELGFMVNPNTPSELLGDKSRIRQVITNILSNGIKYTRVGGVRMTVDFEKVYEQEINLIIKVSDTGIGIAPENLGSIFTSFKRVDTNLNRDILGTGLGLSITKNLVEMMEGSIGVESTPGVGSVFTVIIPQMVLNPSPCGEFSAKSALGEDGPRLEFYAPDANILVVDDMEMNLRVVKNFLKRTGVHVDTCLDGNICVEKALAHRYDIIFLDHMMPGMDGIDTLRTMRASSDNKNQDTPVIMLTANAISGAKEEYLSAGFTDYLTKPIQINELLGMVHKYLPAEKVRETGRDETDFKEKSRDETIAPVEIEVPVEPLAPSEAGAQDAAAAQEEPGTLRQRFSFLDTDTGLLYNGSDDDLYLLTLSDYLDDDMTDRIMTAYRSGDIKNYGIYVHALKSASLSIGAVTLSERAKAHEMAAKSGRTKYIDDDYAGLLRDYRALLDKLREVL